MHFLQKPSHLLLFALLFVYSCSEIPNHDWTHAVPAKTPFIIIPAEQTSISTTLTSSYIPFLDDITSSAMQLVSQVDSGTPSIEVKAILLYPGADNNLQSVWVTTAPDDFTSRLRSRFYRNFSQNQYFFHNMTIHKLHIRERNLYACQLHNLLLLSESSLGIEDAIRAYLGLQPSAGLSDMQFKPGSLVMNTPSLDKWIEQLAKVIYRPSIMGAFAGTEPIILQVTQNENETLQNDRLTFSGILPFTDTPKSELVAALSEENAPLELDRYISSNAAAFGIFRLSPRLAPPVSVPNTSELDAVLMKNKLRYSKLAKSLRPEFALVAYAESGFLSIGEHLFIRLLDSRSAFQTELNNLVRDGLIQRTGGSYLIQSRVLAQLIGSGLCSFQKFYLDITGNVVVISKRQGLAEVVAQDRNRRRVIYYEQNYMDVRNSFPESISGLLVLNGNFDTFVTPFLAPENYMNAITTQFDFLTITTRLDQTGDNLTFNLTTYQSEETQEPYQERWLFPTGGAELSGDPVLANIGGNPRDEIIFATKSGSVYALAADGTVVLQLDTGRDVPVGPPVAYDWYGTGQNVIMIAAGDKVYGWNDTGSLLPRFPFVLDENITTPLIISDIDRNGLPEAVVATANRRLHVLDGRGINLEGWPVTTNAPVRTKPLIDYLRGELSVLAFSENAIHAWYPDGLPRAGFPKFVNASLSGSPVIYQNNILGGAADGYLYAVGNDVLFSDSLDVYSNTSDSSGIGAVYVSSSPLTGSPSIQQNVSVQTGTDTLSGSMILTMSSNGSVFLLSEEGELRFTQNMGQPGAPGFSPLITDINNDNQNDVVALANYGRLYAWQVLGGERIYSLPTSGIKHYILEDIDGDGYQELIAQTREGVRCWTIYGEQEEQGEQGEQNIN